MILREGANPLILNTFTTQTLRRGAHSERHGVLSSNPPGWLECLLKCSEKS